MSREFEITREVDLPAAPDDVWKAITADAAAWQFPTGLEIPAARASAHASAADPRPVKGPPSPMRKDLDNRG